MTEITRILTLLDGGDPQAAEHLLPAVYDELRCMAATQMAREKPGQTLSATALVHEVYLRLVGGDDPGVPTVRRFEHRRHFFATAAQNRAMELSCQSAHAGWKNAEHAKQDADLDPLRGRADFQKLLEGVGKGA